MEFVIDLSEELLKEAMDLPDDQVTDPRRPVADMLSNAKNVSKFAEQDKDLLATANFDISVLPKVNPIIKGLLGAQSKWTQSGEDETTHAFKVKQLDAELRLERTDLLGILDYAAREKPETQDKLRKIRQGVGRQDLIQDMYDLLTVATENSEELLAINADITKFEQSKAKADEFFEMIGLSNRDAKLTNENKHLRDRIYWLLASYLYPISDVGKYIFRNDPDRKDDYNFSA